MKIKLQYPLYIPGIYQVYTSSRYINGMCMVYTYYIPCRGSRWARTSVQNSVNLVILGLLSLLSLQVQGSRAGARRAASESLCAFLQLD
jgi:hypothetical protein